MHKLRCGKHLRDIRTFSHHSMPRGKLLCNFWTNGNNGDVCRGQLLRGIGINLLELRCWHIPSKFKPSVLFQLPCGELLWCFWFVSRDGHLRCRELLDSLRNDLLELRLWNISAKHHSELVCKLRNRQFLCNDWTLCCNGMPRWQLLRDCGIISRDGHMRFGQLFVGICNCLL